MQSPYLAVARADSRVAQLERHQADVGSDQDNGAAEPAAELAERPAVVERSRRNLPQRQRARERVPVPRHGDLRNRRHGIVGRRSVDADGTAALDPEEAAAADRRRSGFRGQHNERRHDRAYRQEDAVLLQLGRGAGDTLRTVAPASDRARLLDGRGVGKAPGDHDQGPAGTFGAAAGVRAWLAASTARTTQYSPRSQCSSRSWGSRCTACPFTTTSW